MKHQHDLREQAFQMSASNLRFGGLQAYQGAAQHVRKVEDRRAAIEKAAADVRRTRELLETAGIGCPKVTGAGTGTVLLLRWFWWRFNIWGELFGLVISVPLASLIWFGLGANTWPFWQPIVLLLGVGLAGSIIVALLTPAESAETLRSFYLKIRPPGIWGPVRRALAAEGLCNAAQQRRELTWDLLAAASGIAFCFSMVYAFFLSVVLNWRDRAKATTLLSNALRDLARN